mmetsp:Transcript_1979/g.2491  ORF Transcript_1979/g.2491 Transcript_1979/m.2491 type:complete len:215 (-) Transcript_1979:347-991(-)
MLHFSLNCVSWVWAVGVVVAWIFSFSVSSVMFNSSSPGINWLCESTVRLDGDVVLTSDNSEKAVLTPGFSPGVSSEPVFGSILDSVSYNGDVVHDVLVPGRVSVDASSVVLVEVHGNCDTAGEGSVLINVLHHVGLTRHSSVVSHLVDVVLIRNEAGLVRVAISALSDRRALVAVVKTSCVVNRTRLVSYVLVVSVFISGKSISSVASEVFARA